MTDKGEEDAILRNIEHNCAANHVASSCRAQVARAVYAYTCTCTIAYTYAYTRTYVHIHIRIHMHACRLVSFVLRTCMQRPTHLHVYTRMIGFMGAYY